MNGRKKQTIRQTDLAMVGYYGISGADRPASNRIGYDSYLSLRDASSRPTLYIK